MGESMRQRFVRVVGDLLAEDERVAVVLAVISRGLFEQAGLTTRYPDRIIDVGIREQAQIGVAGGLAIEGFLPIATGYAPFLVERPFEQIKLAFGHQGVRAILASVGASYDSAGSGRTHHAPEDVALMGTLPGWQIHVPGTPAELEVAMRAAHASPASTYVRMGLEANRTPHAERSGEVSTIRRGSQGAPTVLAVGPVADVTLAATADLDVTVLYTMTPRPLDGRGLRSGVTGQEITLVEPYLAGTSVHAVAEVFSDTPMIIRSHGIVDPELRRYGTVAEHRAAHRLDAIGIRSVLTGVLNVA